MIARTVSVQTPIDLTALTKPFCLAIGTTYETFFSDRSIEGMADETTRRMKLRKRFSLYY
jgi:hypothetical protein